MNPASGEGVEVAGECGDEGLAFAGLHLGDLAGVQGHAADHLHVEVAHADGALAGFADDGEGFGKDFVEGGLLGGVDFLGVGDAVVGWNGLTGSFDAGFELGGLGAELLVGERGECLLMAADGGKPGKNAFDGTVVGGAENFGDDFVEQGGFPSCVGARGDGRRDRNL